MLKNLYFKPKNEEEVLLAIELCREKEIYVYDDLYSTKWSDYVLWGLDKEGDFVADNDENALVGVLVSCDEAVILDFDDWCRVVDSSDKECFQDFLEFLESEGIFRGKHEAELIYKYFKRN